MASRQSAAKPTPMETAQELHKYIKKIPGNGVKDDQLKHFFTNRYNVLSTPSILHKSSSPVLNVSWNPPPPFRRKS